MKFAAKMSLAVTILLAVALSAGGGILVHQNFNDSLGAAVRQNTSQHMLERYALENELGDIARLGGGVSDEQLVRYGAALNSYLGDGVKLVSLYDDALTEIYGNFPGEVPAETRRAMLASREDNYRVLPCGSGVYMLMASYVSGTQRGLWLLSGYDLTFLFRQRQAQLHNLWRVGSVTLALAVLLVVALSMWLTRPIRRLSRVSRRIAGGAYSVRCEVRTGDEIGELAQSFDEMAAAVEEQVDELNASVHRRDDFVSAFSHEMKTPMTSIIGYSDIVRSMECDATTRHIAANHIYHEAKRLESLSQKLLALMGIAERGPEFTQVKLASIFAAAHRSLLPLPAGVAIEFEPCLGTLVYADRDLAADLLRNLILNAIKAEPRDGKVQVVLRRDAGRCHVSVTDTGCGIPPEELERILEPFYMVDKSRSRERGGTGIGLALCERIARAHGGTLSIKSIVGEGTTVGFSLPLWKEEDTPDETQ